MDFPSQIFLPQKTIFAKGAWRNLPQEVLGYGSRGLIVHGQSLVRSGKKDEILARFCADARIESFCRAGFEPTLSEISEVITCGLKCRVQWIAGIGGGSVLDLAKAAAGLFNAKQKPQVYQEGGKLEEPGIPFIGVPTTAGTGAEATINSVIINSQKGIKRSIRDECFLAKKVILDIELLGGLPQTAMGYAAMDAYVQAYESFIARGANWFSEVLALKAIELIDKNILPARSSASDDNLSALLLGSYFAGIALASSRLGVIHGIAHPLGAIYNIAHGLICALCFPASIELNRQAIGSKYAIISDTIGQDLRQRINSLLENLRISSPFKDKTLVEKEKIISETLTSGSTAANPKSITAEDVEFILEKLF